MGILCCFQSHHSGGGGGKHGGGDQAVASSSSASSSSSATSSGRNNGRAEPRRAGEEKSSRNNNSVDNSNLVALVNEIVADSVSYRHKRVAEEILKMGKAGKDKRRFAEMADPLLQGNYPTKGLYQALAIAAMCLQEDATMRPAISDVVTALEYLTVAGGGAADDDTATQAPKQQQKIHEQDAQG
ncbi:hypothetical protein EJB05_44188 [Eragrostis curvula]|uniref:Serine-threonine/tyrosine-protein kinase catalytic domain-containing protein n=1 Tax=Eragrostis curvula TaxID=38414 RepID=A0A5J9TH84_9POAL|nr:hypothetical protein EJB05_44188 [Eragrostis curvula]